MLLSMANFQSTAALASREEKDQALTLFTSTYAVNESDNISNESTESLENLSWKDVRNQLINEPNMAVSWISDIPYK